MNGPLGALQIYTNVGADPGHDPSSFSKPVFNSILSLHLIRPLAFFFVNLPRF